MSLKTRILVLKRKRAGDQDILVKAYGQGGIIDLLVRDGLVSGHRFFGVFEPFNVMELDMSQRGGIALPNDVKNVRFLSYIARDYRRFLWMSWVAGFIMRTVHYYDERLFSLFLRYLTLSPEKKEHVLRIRLKLDYLELSGLKPKFLDQRGSGTKLKLSNGSISEEGELEVESHLLDLIRKIYRARKPERISLSGELSKRIEKVLDLLIEYHTR